MNRQLYVPTIALTLTLGALAAACGSKAPAEYDQAPVLANREEVVEALRAMGGGLQAQVMLMVHVDTEGAVREVRVTRGSGDDALDDAARWVGRRMRFQPALHEGRAVPAWVQVPVTFDVISPASRSARIRNAVSIAAIMSSEHEGLSGEAVMMIRVNSQGVVTGVKDARGGSDEILEVAQRLARQLKFWPAKEGFRASDAWVTCHFEFDGPRSRVWLEEEAGAARSDV
jgi:TonB family protein